MAVALGVVFIVIFGWGYWGSRSVSGDRLAPKNSGQNVVRTGRIDQYYYVIRSGVRGNEQQVTFTPALRGDDTVVVDVARRVLAEAYRVSDPEAVQPTVVSHEERNYLQFRLASKRVYVELRSNKKGEVGSFTFWE
jgi:hypothetical protein